MKIAVVKGGQLLLTPQITLDRSLISDHQNNNRKQSLLGLAAVVAELRQEAKEKGMDKMPKREIKAAVNAARVDLKKANNHRAK